MADPIPGVAVLPPPYEIFDYPAGGVFESKVLGWTSGQALIKPKATNEEKYVQVIRLQLPPEARPAGMPYLDVTSKTLQAQLAPVLQDIVQNHRTVRITKYGVAPAARFSLEVL